MLKRTEKLTGGFSTNDGTIDFYLRVRSILTGGERIVDYGAGRASWNEDDPCKIRKKIRDLRDVADEVIAVDPDDIVMANNASTHQQKLEDGRTTCLDASVDLIICDYVFEHVDNVSTFSEEVDRILRPGGWLCARTPHKYSYVALLSALISNRYHTSFLKYLQPNRKEIDVFPTKYFLNTHRSIACAFPKWENKSFIYKVQPAYYCENIIIFAILSALHTVMPTYFSGNIFVFLQKPGG